MPTRWDKYGADSLRIGLINFLLENCRDHFWEVHHRRFFGRWDSIHNSDFSELNKMPKLRSGGVLRLIALSSKKRAIVLSNGTPWKGSPYFEMVETIKAELIPDEMRWPRAKDYDYQSNEWKNWIAFIGRLANDYRMLSWSPGTQPSNWARNLETKFSNMVPLNDRAAILKAYREHGF